MPLRSRRALSAWASLVLAACSTAAGGPDGGPFELCRVELGHAVSAVATLDVDRDGHVDLLAAGGGSLTVLRGDGAGAFAVAATVPAGPYSCDVVLGDVNLDGWTDALVPNHESDHLTLSLGGPDGFVAERTRRLPVDVDPHPHAAALLDVDGDGHTDILIDDRNRGAVAVLRGDGDGGFAPGPSIPVGGDPYRGMALADVDGDGDTDLVTPNPRVLALHLADGEGGFVPGARLEPRTGPFAAAAGDWDGDGRIDLAAGSGEGVGEVTVWWGREGGAFDEGATREVAVGPLRLATADLDGDGIEDLVASSWVGSELAILTGSADRALRLTRVVVDGNPWGTAFGDFDEDGATDLAVGEEGGSGVTVLLARER